MCSNEGGTLSFQALNRALLAGLLLGGWVIAAAHFGAGQEVTRKIKSQVLPKYPDLARRMKLTGVVRVQVTISPNGSVKSAKLVGGHPVLATAALDAIRKWRFENGPEETTGVLEVRFDPSQ